MEIDTDTSALEKVDQNDFISSAMTKISIAPLSHCKHVGSVIAFDGYIVKVSSLPCIVGSLCSIENESGATVTGEVVRIDEASVDIVPHDNSFALAIGDKAVSYTHLTLPTKA